MNGVDFELAQGEVLGVLGESGSGKSVTLRALLRILPTRRSRIGGRSASPGATCSRSPTPSSRSYRGGSSR